MLRIRLLTAAAAVALVAAPAAFAQAVPGPAPVTPLPTQPAPVGPATTDTSAVPAVQAATPVGGQTVVDVLKTQGQFSTLLAALDAAQLTDTLKAQPAVSIFAPTDAAFAALPEAERARLMDPANVAELRQVLLYHVIVADVNSSQIKGTKGSVQTAASGKVLLDGTGASIKIDEATVTTADIDGGNGAVFVIDKVLSPTASTDPSAPAQASPATSAPAPTPPVAATQPTAEPTDETPDTPVTPPTPQ